MGWDVKCLRRAGPPPTAFATHVLKGRSGTGRKRLYPSSTHDERKRGQQRYHDCSCPAQWPRRQCSTHASVTYQPAVPCTAYPLIVCSRSNRNVVATCNLAVELDLKTIALHARNAEYNPKAFRYQHVSKLKKAHVLLAHCMLTALRSRDHAHPRA